MNLEGYSFIDKQGKECIIVGYYLSNVFKQYYVELYATSVMTMLYELKGTRTVLSHMLNNEITTLYILRENKIITIDKDSSYVKTAKPYHGKDLDVILLKAKLIQPELYSYKEIERMFKEVLNTSLYKDTKESYFAVFKEIWQDKNTQIGINYKDNGYCYYDKNTFRESKTRKRRLKEEKEFVRFWSL